METIKNYIGGELIEPVGGGYLDNVEPATGNVYSRVPDSDERDVDRAVAAAKAAFPEWSRMPVEKRSRMLLAVADRIEANLDRLARAETIDNGKPITLARSLDIPRAVTNIRFFATAILHAHSECHPMDDVALNYTLRQPRGVAGIISPWNLPLYLLTWKIGPALATGNTVVAKPSEVTPMTAYLLSELAIEAGLPPGVLNIVHGLGSKAGAALVRHPDVPTISFTGGTVTGREIARSACPMFKKVSLELGGKNPNIIFADADMDQAIPGTVRSSFANQGQVCLCGSRVFIERTAYGSFLERFIEQTKHLRIGDPLEDATQHGAVVSKAQYEKVLSYLKLAREEGGTIHCGGGRPDVLPARCANGYFIAPTIITGLPPTCRTNQEEIFGPVVTVTPFDSDEEAVEVANGVEYGLSASIWTGNVTRAHCVSRALQCGTVWVNCWLVRDLRVPFGGTKQSGVGREGGDEAIRFFTEPKNVCVKL